MRKNHNGYIKITESGNCLNCPITSFKMFSIDAFHPTNAESLPGPCHPTLLGKDFKHEDGLLKWTMPRVVAISYIIADRREDKRAKLICRLSSIEN